MPYESLGSGKLKITYGKLYLPFLIILFIIFTNIILNLYKSNIILYSRLRAVAEMASSTTAEPVHTTEFSIVVCSSRLSCAESEPMHDELSNGTGLPLESQFTQMYRLKRSLIHFSSIYLCRNQHTYKTVFIIEFNGIYLYSFFVNLFFKFRL